MKKITMIKMQGCPYCAKAAQAVEELRAILCAEHCKPAERMNMIINRKEM